MRLFDSKDQLEELQYDVDNAIPDIDGWKAHILREVHQDKKCGYRKPGQ